MDRIAQFKEHYEMTKMIVWLDGEEDWHRTYLCKDNGKLYIRIGAGIMDLAELNNCFIRKVETI